MGQRVPTRQLTRKDNVQSLMELNLFTGWLPVSIDDAAVRTAATAAAAAGAAGVHPHCTLHTEPRWF